MIFWIVIIIVYVLLASVFFWLLKSILKAMLFAVGVISFLFLVFGVLTILDARSFVEDSKVSDQIFILKQDDRMVAGARNVLSQKDDTDKNLLDSEFDKYSELYKEKDYDSMLKDNYKVFVIDMSAFESLTDEDFSSFEGIDRKFVFDALLSESALETLITKTVSEANITKEYEGILRENIRKEAPQEAAIRSTLFTVLISASLKKHGLTFMADQLKDEKMKVYPSSMMFLAMEVIPSSVFGWAADMIN